MSHPQHMQALARANEIRLTRARQHHELRGAPPERLISVLLDPSAELGSYRLGDLFAPRSQTGLIPRFGEAKLEDLLRNLNRGGWGLRTRIWHSGLRLRDLTERERRHLGEALLRHAPRGWRA